MNQRRVIRAIQVVIVAASLVAGGTASAGVLLGASFGYTHLSYPDLANFTNNIVGIPGAEEWHQPGIRVGYIAPGRRWDLNVDAGLFHRAGTIGADETTFELFPQIQVDARAQGGFSPFVNGGVGIEYETVSVSGNTAVSATRPVFGGGIGVRKSVGGDHGFLRLELRFDHLNEYTKSQSPFGTVTFPSTNLFSVKLGFDLIVTR